MDSKIVYIVGCYSQTGLNFKKQAKSLIKLRNGIAALDSSGNYYYKKNNKFTKGQIDYFRNNSDAFPDEERKAIISLDNLFESEYKKYGKIEQSEYIAMKPITIDYVEFKLKVNIVFKIYSDNIIVCNFEFPLHNYSVEQIKKIITYIDGKNFKSVDLPSEYLDTKRKDSFLNGKYIKLIADPSLKSFSQLSNEIINMVLKEKILNSLYNRIEIFIDKTSLTDNEIQRLLHVTDFDLKNKPTLKDYRYATDFYHYSNELNSLLFGKDLKNAKNIFPLIDDYIIYKLVQASMNYKKIVAKKYSLKELKQIKHYYKNMEATQIYIPYVETNDYIKEIFKLRHRDLMVSNIIESIDDEINASKDIYEFLFQTLGVVLAMPSLFDYIIKPLIEHIYDIELKYPADVSVYSTSILLILIIINTLKYLFFKHSGLKTK